MFVPRCLIHITVIDIVEQTKLIDFYEKTSQVSFCWRYFVLGAIVGRHERAHERFMRRVYIKLGSWNWDVSNRFFRYSIEIERYHGILSLPKSFYSSHSLLQAICNFACIWNLGKISAQPHTTLCIQFLNRENNDKNNTFPLRKQICFAIVWGCTETLPRYLQMTTEFLAKPRKNYRLNENLTCMLNSVFIRKVLVETMIWFFLFQYL